MAALVRYQILTYSQHKVPSCASGKGLVACMELENGFLKAPWEILLRQNRSGRRVVDKELEAITEAVARLKTQAGSDTSETASQDVPSDVRDLAIRIRGLKRKVSELHEEEGKGLRNVKARLDHLSELQTAKGGKNENPFNLDAGTRWERIRYGRFLIDWMLRHGLYDSAEKLIAHYDVDELCNLKLFKSSVTVVNALKRRDCSEALNWYASNRRRLVKAKSELEVRLRLQEFVELAREGKAQEAIAYAKTYFSAYVDRNLQDIQRAMALLAFPENTECDPYKGMYAAERWQDLINMFKDDYHKLHGLTKDSTLEIVMKAGLATLKTQYCAKDDSDRRNPKCPTCTEPFYTLSQDLPRSMHVHSVLVCRITGEIMDENNAPMVLPNGNVYSAKALNAMVEKNENGIVDPRTKDTYTSTSVLRKAFIM